MRNDKEYLENQQFRHPVLWAGFGLGAFYIFGHSLGAFIKNMTIVGDGLFTSILFALVILLFFFAKLSTQINEEGIRIKFFPFHTKSVLYPWEQIQELKIITYRPLRDFGGWGIRYGPKGIKAFNVSGKDGLLITLKNGQKRMVGTQQLSDLETFLKQSNKTFELQQGTD